MSSSQFVDYRPQMKLSQGGCNGSIVLCNYEGEERMFLHFWPPGRPPTIGHITKQRTITMPDGSRALALTISNFYENWKEYLVPTYLTYYKVSEEDLVMMNGGKRIYLNVTTTDRVSSSPAPTTNEGACIIL